MININLFIFNLKLKKVNAVLRTCLSPTVKDLEDKRKTILLLSNFWIPAFAGMTRGRERQESV